MGSQDNLHILRKKISDVLGETRENNYLFFMKQWFRGRSSKEEFDNKAREIFPYSYIHLHNEFLLAILAKCQVGISSHSYQNNYIKLESDNYQHQEAYAEQPTPKKTKYFKSTEITNEPSFDPVDVMDVIPSGVPREASAIAETAAGYYEHTLYMLDSGPIKGRILLCAWDHGLMGTSEDVISLIQVAVKDFLKNILTAVITKRKSFRSREGKFKHSIGARAINPWLRNANNIYDLSSCSYSLHYTDDEDSDILASDINEQNEIHMSSCSAPFDPPLYPITLFDLYSTLKVDRNLIPTHSVYSLNMERISSRLWHPSAAELEQEEIFRKESFIRQSYKQQRSVSIT